MVVTVTNFFKQESDKLSDDDLFKLLADVKKPSVLLKKLKCVPGEILFVIFCYSYSHA